MKIIHIIPSATSSFRGQHRHSEPAEESSKRANDNYICKFSGSHRFARDDV